MKIQSHFARSLAIITIVTSLACAGAVGAGSVVIPDTPDGTVKAVAENLAEGRPEVLWMALPPSYQQDITDITHAFANKMDPELYNKTFSLLNKAVVVLTDKKDIIQGSSMIKTVEEDDLDTVEEGWDTAMALLGTLLTSDISDLEKMKTFNYEDFFKGTATALMEQAAAMSAEDPEDPYAKEFQSKFEAMTVELLNTEGDHATLVISAPDEEPEQVEMTRVEGRWIPTDMADDWAEEVAEAKQKIEEITPESLAETKMQAMMMLAMAESFVDQVGQVNSSEELDALIGGMFGSMMGGMGAPPAGAPSEEPGEELGEEPSDDPSDG